MLALWSRATRAPGTCRCISCVSRNALPTSRTGARAPWILGAPTSTFVYTSIFAAGLAIDAKSKQRRNQQWDTAFEHLLDEMEHPPANESLSPEIDMDVLHRIAGNELTGWKSEKDVQSQVDGIDQVLESFWDYLPFDDRRPGGPNQSLPWPANTGPDLIKSNLPPQSLWSPDHARWKAMRKRQSWKKMAMQELGVGELIHALLGHSGVSELPATQFASLSPVIRDIALLSPEERLWAGKHIVDNMIQLSLVEASASPEEIDNIQVRIKGPGIPAYYQDSDGDFYNITQQLNSAIRKLFQEDSQSNDRRDWDNLPLILAKVCHNLLVSSAAPDLQTFNFLLVALKRRKQPELVSRVIKAFDNCKIRPNEISCAAILDHHVETDNIDAFSHFVARMRGSRDALMLARPDITINEKGQSRLVRVSADKVLQKVHSTPLVFNSLMLGVLKFAGFNEAVDVYFDMKEDGWGLDTLGLSHFLRDCVRRADWNGGVLIWEEISSIRQKINRAHMAKAYAEMLSLCSVTGNTVAFNQLLNEVARRGYDRRRIMASVMAAEQRNAEAGEQTPLAPAFAADNLLIAVSDLLRPGNEEPGVDDIDNSPSVSDQFPADASDFATSDATTTQTSSAGLSETPRKLSDEEAWAQWLQHELGENPLLDESSVPATRGDDLSTLDFNKHEKAKAKEKERDSDLKSGGGAFHS